MMKLILIGTLALLMASCRSSRPISKAITPKDSTTFIKSPLSDTLQQINTALQGIKAARIAYTTFSAKVNVDYEGTDGKKYDVNANIKMYRDSAIWVSVNAVLGIEALRLLITRDSVKVLNKLEKTYVGRSVSYLQEITSLPLDLSTLQDLIIGHPVYLDTNITRYSNANGILTLLSTGYYFKNFSTFNESDKTIVRSKLDDTNPARSRTADLSYTGYENNKGFPFSTRRQIVVAEKTRLNMKLDFKNYELNGDVSFPFSVPKNYSRN